METTAAEIRTEIAAERRELADVLDGLTDAQWDAPTLCGGWRVRETAGHMSMGFRYSFGRTALELVRAGGNLHRMTDRVARRDAAALAPRELAAALRDNAHHPWTPPVGGLTSALGHDVIHGLDITVPLGLGRQVPEQRLRILLGTVTPRTLRFFRADLEGVTLRATDLDWSYGTAPGARVESRPAQELLLLAYGRTLPRPE
ncbi:maleylpyruvate isomerase family mycothiol-dependent enzyme [Streptomyces sp. NPDC052494]|uniref:maleylpyruvate isomerase family mycothiol-dependent enzyme n=1 Tax=Streptomyces sp. NPDC052494 TaxID=3365692 RepID=UPI0037D5DD10